MKYNSPLMKILETVANMIIVSFFWFVCSIPILTVIPASTALYHTSHKIIFSGKGNGVTKDFFVCFKENFVQGIKINVIVVIAAFFIVIGINTGLQIYKLSIFGMAYLILGILITFVCVTSLIYVPAVISRFYLRIIDIIRLSVFFALQNIFISILNVVLLVIIVYLTYTVPIALLIVPALYVDLTRPGIEKKMVKFISDNNLQEYETKQETIEESNEDISMYDLNNKLKSNRKKK